AGDVSVSIAEIELISIKVRLVICSVDKAIEMGINWWQKDPYLSSATEIQQLQSQNNELIKRLEALEKKNAKSK
ncbi:MAG: gas vesicle protein, partial [Ekhidna sp.]|nr:gas vesicle protein [Ekhidna sp.]